MVICLIAQGYTDVEMQYTAIVDTCIVVLSFLSFCRLSLVLQSVLALRRFVNINNQCRNYS